MRKSASEGLPSLYALSRQIGAETDLQRVLQTVVKTVAEAVDAEAAIFMPDPVTNLLIDIASTPPLSAPLDDKERAMTHWVLEHGQRAGKGTDTLSGAEHLFVPINTDDNTMACSP